MPRAISAANTGSSTIADPDPPVAQPVPALPLQPGGAASASLSSGVTSDSPASSLAITLSAVLFAVISGIVVVEKVFAYPGLGIGLALVRQLAGSAASLPVRTRL